MSRITFITGGARSGKSRYALARAADQTKKAFIATATISDDEMRNRIAHHQAERGESFVTIEEPRDLARAVRDLPPDIDIAIIDCLTVWLGNLMHEYRNSLPEPVPEIDTFLSAITSAPCPLLIVSNEVGMGIVPDNAMARAFRDRAGTLNQNVAARADEVILVVSGIPVPIGTRGQ